eukprot:CAMPEP_0197851976 /NCGR_PEP_ID=MMETSP1438-20131217/19370_1 /TAXON_ID=1461541 /ORGANISM="Pterosperma sp., Strain CCMP1384" /LENGTH=664 /DNA_ID=CAMNT_0043465797 /DNA_START=153 /DNA_END=2147 /DNA_ORIENTATION=+
MVHKIETVLHAYPLITESNGIKKSDSMLARELFAALNPSLFGNSNSAPSTRTPHPPQAPRQREPARRSPPASACGHCGQQVVGECIRAAEGVYHPGCFRCSDCGHQITNKFSMNAAKRPVCEDCTRSHAANARAAASLGNCGKCRRTVTGTHVKTGTGAVYHPDCFRCTDCNAKITSEFSLNDSNNPVCSRCSQRNRPICQICNERIPVDASGQMRYHEHPYWKDKYCARHDMKRIKSCTSCGRMENTALPHMQLGDGRQLCTTCCGRDNLIDSKDCQGLYDEILQFYANTGMPLSQRVPMMLVDFPALNEVAGKEGGRHSGECRGLTLTEIHQVPTIVSDSGRHGPDVQSMVSAFGVNRQSVRLVRHCEVTAILVLFGLPRLLTGSILAHEVMHAWLRLNSRRFSTNLDLQVEEGICQVMGYLWLEAEHSRLSTPGRAQPSTSATTSATTSAGPSRRYQVLTEEQKLDALIDRLGKLSVKELKSQLERANIDWRSQHVNEKRELVMLLATDKLKKSEQLSQGVDPTQGGRPRSPLHSGAFEADENFTESREYWEYVKNQIRTDRSPVYGEGFRKAWAAYEKFGLKSVLESISKTGRLPKVDAVGGTRAGAGESQGFPSVAPRAGGRMNAPGRFPGAGAKQGGLREKGLPPIAAMNNRHAIFGF